MIAAIGMALASAALVAGSAGTPAPSAEGARVRVHLDCDVCDFDFLRRKLTFVDWVTDRQVAEVEVLVTEAPTGGGGTHFDIRFLGQAGFLGADDEALFDVAPSSPDDLVRRGLLHVFSLGLVRYASHSGVAPDLDVAFVATPPPPGSLRDPWNLWVFRITGSASFSGQQTVHAASGSFSTAASRTTDLWRIGFNTQSDYSESSYRLEGPPPSTVKSYTRDAAASTTIVRGFGPHFSGQAYAVTAFNSYLNEAAFVAGSLAAEWSAFPYSEALRHQLTFRYSVSENWYRWQHTTIYGYDVEYRPAEGVTGTFQAIQPWGAISLVTSAQHYFPDAKQYDVSSNAFLDLKVVRGLSITLSGSLGLLHDQLYLSAEGATEAEVLLQRRQLATSYTYSSSIGVTYRFGSIYNDVVNPRFGGVGLHDYGF